MKRRIVLIPQHMKKFQCIGPNCEDNCCYGWKVDINQDMYKKYKKVVNPELKMILNKNITRNRSNPSNEHFAKIRMNSEGDCPFLCEDRLCNLQKTLGAGYLSKVCMTYPRVFNVVNGVLEKSLYFSCPEAARVALLNPNLMEFDEIEEDFDTPNIISAVINTEEIKYSNKVQKYFWSLRIFAITLLQNRNYKLSDRLIILGIFIQKIQSCIEEDKISCIPDIIDNFYKIIKEDGLKEQLREIPTNFAMQMELMKEINDQRFSFGITPNTKAYLQCVKEFLEGIQYVEDCSVEEVAKIYDDAYKNYYKPFMDKHEYILENFLVNYVFKEMFPIASKEGAFDDYMKMVVHYSLVKMMLIGMSSYFKKLDEDIVIRLVYSFSRAIDHNQTFLYKAFNLLRENQYNTMAYMAILIKN